MFLYQFEYKIGLILQTFIYLNSFMWDKVRKYIDGYLNQTHMQSLTVFQTLLEQANDIQFIPEKLSTYKLQNNLKKKNCTELQYGLNKLNSISIVILRSIHSNNFTFLLASQNLPVMSLSKYIFIVVVWPKEQDLIARWKQQLSLNMWVTVRQPYKMSRNDDAQYLIVRLQNLVIQQGKRWKQKSQSVKQKANILFKNKQYIQAFSMYQFALCNNHQYQKSYQRAILYGNSAACLYQLRLFSSSVLYCNLAIRSDPKYPKGYTRKLNCLLQLSQYTLIPPTLLKLKSLISQKQFEYYNQKFTNYMTNDIGIFNWKQIFSNGLKQKNTNATKQNTQKFGGFGQYHSNKIQIKKVDSGQAYIAREDINQHQLILVNKPMIYFKVSKASKRNFQVILDQVKKNCILQKSFYEMMKLCPPITPGKPNQQNAQYNYNGFHQNSNSIFKHPVDKFFSTQNQQTLVQAQLIGKLELSLFMERFLQQLDDNIGYGLWRDTFYFPLDCNGNCSYVHLKNSFTVFATRDIKKGQTLTIDYLADVEALIRSKIMHIKYNKTCDCKYCSLTQWPQNYNGDIQGLYQLIDNLPDIKTKKQMICQIIIKKAQNQQQSQFFDSIFPGIIYKYIIFVEKDPHWEDILNLLRILRDQQDPDLSNSLFVCLMNCFNKYLKIPHSEAKSFLELIQ